MSESEYQKLIGGEVLVNSQDHHKERGRKTTSVGFCFFVEEPSEAIRWLSGICYPDCCVTLDIPDELLTESYGLYLDPDKYDEYSEYIVKIWKLEYCLQRYSLNDGVKILSMTTEYAWHAQMRRKLVEMGIIK